MNINEIELNFCCNPVPYDEPSDEPNVVKVPVYGITAFGILRAPEYFEALVELCKRFLIFNDYGYDQKTPANLLIAAIMNTYADSNPLIYADVESCTFFVPPLHPFVGPQLGMTITSETRDHVFDEIMGFLDVACESAELPITTENTRTPKWFLQNFDIALEVC